MACGDWDTYSEHQTSQNNINLENITPNSPQLPLFLRYQFFYISDGRMFTKERKCNVVIIRKTNKPSVMMITVIRLELDEVIMLIQ